MSETKREITCPHCGYKGEGITESEGRKVKIICPQCGNPVGFRRKK